jgi:hypothetical protein
LATTTLPKATAEAVIVAASDSDPPVPKAIVTSSGTGCVIYYKSYILDPLLQAFAEIPVTLIAGSS